MFTKKQYKNISKHFKGYFYLIKLSTLIFFFWKYNYFYNIYYFLKEIEILTSCFDYKF